ncbi:hypothetical protein ACI5KX_13095 [Erythrobacter sp. GH1-10]|uniref:hypothetical protein n=1 Tax=Erythrobacter sp. GH1-10 TaxID=3349334 RepID=UPI0038781553
MLFATIFLVCFVVLGGVVMYLSQTIDHGEARFDADGKVIKDEEPKRDGPVEPARRIEKDVRDDT